MRSFVKGGKIDIAIVGGGATGVELAVELSRMVDLAAGYGEADTHRRLRLTLLESEPRILNASQRPFPPRPHPSCVRVRTGVRVVAADAEGYMLDGERVTAALKVWAAGIRASSDYNAFGTLGRFGFFKGGFIKGRFAHLSHALLYRRHQLSLHGPGRAALLWLAQPINALVQPDIRIS